MRRRICEREWFPNGQPGRHLEHAKRQIQHHEAKMTTTKDRQEDASTLTQNDLRVGRTYRAKRPAASGNFFEPLINDRTITWIGGGKVQYDGPAVAIGRRRPIVDADAFIKWADRDVTDELPEGEYAPWPQVGKK